MMPRLSFASILSFCLLVVVIAVIPEDFVPEFLEYEQPYYRICPLPRCEECPSIEELRAPGVGFALEISHGTAVVRHHNGTYDHIALIEGDEAYEALMRRFATGPINREPDSPEDFANNWQKLFYVKRRTLRLLNKFLGRPATPETATLASMISQLLHATQSFLGPRHRILAAVLSSPDRIELTDEELGDIFSYLRTRNLMKDDGTPRSMYQLYAASAAYAGYGKGLCEKYIDAYACEAEEWDFPWQRVLHLDLSGESLSGTVKDLQSAKEDSGQVAKAFVDVDLGLIRESEEYWSAVSDRIRGLVLSCGPVRPSELILTGSEARNRRFKDAVRRALHGLITDGDVFALLEGYDEREQWRELFTFATARGAAEFAKRRQEGPVGCADRDECRRRREVVHGEHQGPLVNQWPEGILV